MRRFGAIFLGLALAIPSLAVRATEDAEIALPAPSVSGPVSVEAAIAKRRSERALQSTPLTLDQLSQLLWAAQGVTDTRGYRTTPSAGALYPLTIYAAVGSVQSLETGLYRYRTNDHGLVGLGAKDLRRSLTDAAFGQAWMTNAPVILVITGREATTRRKYGDRAPQFVAIEVGHAAQNVYLQAEALGLGTTAVGGFDEEKMHAAIGLAEDEDVLLLLPVGIPSN